MKTKINKNQKALMKKAGFKATFPFGEMKCIDPLVSWVRGDITILFFSTENLSLDCLIDRVVVQTAFIAVKAERSLSRPPVDEIRFKYKNK